MKIKTWVYVSDGGDGSVIPHFFKTQAEAEARALKDEEYNACRFDEDIQMVYLDLTDFEVVE